jgi:hypothetical protein
MSAPEWWFSLSGAFFAVALLGVFFGFVLLAVLTFAAIDGWLFLRGQRKKVSEAIDHVKSLAAKAENIGDDASVRAKGLLSQVDDAALKGMEVVEKAAPALAALGMVFGASRLARPRRKKSKKR